VPTSSLSDKNAPQTLRRAGGLGSKPGDTWDQQFEAQKFASLDFDVMRAAFEVNTIGPLLVSKALAPLMASPGGKILTITSLMGSISDNTSGGVMAYRWGSLYRPPALH
jgi:NAD(P)-dependent dehydrogenase (short-subunit alcohol dehydrogenase family)